MTDKCQNPQCDALLDLKRDAYVSMEDKGSKVEFVPRYVCEVCGEDKPLSGLLFEIWVSCDRDCTRS